MVPNFSMKLSKSGSTVVLKVDLKKVPEQLINFQPTPTHLHLDTFKYSKKFVIHKAYPHNLTVDAGPDSYATVEYGMLTALLPVHGHEAATPNKLAGATSTANRDAKKRNRDDETQPVAAKKKQKAPKGQGLAEKEAAKAAMVAAAEAAVCKVTRIARPSPPYLSSCLLRASNRLTLLAQVADVTKAKAAVVNEKLEWEELDKQEQVPNVPNCDFRHSSRACRNKRRLPR